jgi:hypothetical protein
MSTIELRLSVDERELLDAAEDLERLLDADGDDDFAPSLRDLLVALDDAITAVYSAHVRAAPRLAP